MVRLQLLFYHNFLDLIIGLGLRELEGDKEAKFVIIKLFH